MFSMVGGMSFNFFSTINPNLKGTIQTREQAIAWAKKNPEVIVSVSENLYYPARFLNFDEVITDYKVQIGCNKEFNPLWTSLTNIEVV